MSLYPALIKSQFEFPKIVKSCTIKETTSRQGKKYGGYSYADLPSILEAITPVLNRNNLFLHQQVECTNDGVNVETVVFDEEGTSLRGGKFFVPIAGLTQSGPQAFGSAQTYARRYSVLAFFGLGQDDDDGSAAIGWGEAQIQRNPPKNMGQAQEVKRPAPQPVQKPQVKPLDVKQTCDAFRKAGNIATLEKYYHQAKQRATPEQMETIDGVYNELKPVYEDFKRQGMID